MLYEENNEEVVVIDIDSNGSITALYDDQLHDLFTSLGTLRRPRASEINEDPDTGLFVADLSKINGPVLPGQVLKRDAERLEVEWITKNFIGFNP